MAKREGILDQARYDAARGDDVATDLPDGAPAAESAPGDADRTSGRTPEPAGV